MQVTVLGSGTVDPRPSRASTGFLVEASGSAILLDLGAGALRNGLLAGVDMSGVETVLLTHHHPDHTSDLVPFLFARKYATGSWQSSPELTVYGPLGTADFLARVFAAWPSIQPEDGRLAVKEISGESGPVVLSGSGLTLTAFDVVHGDMQALAFRLEGHDRVVAFSGDTALCPGVTHAAHQADLFFCECSCFPRGVEPLFCRQVHLSWEDVAEICEIAQPQKLVLTHLYEPVMARRPNPLESLTEALKIPVVAAEDRAIYVV